MLFPTTENYIDGVALAGLPNEIESGLRMKLKRIILSETYHAQIWFKVLL